MIFNYRELGCDIKAWKIIIMSGYEKVENIISWKKNIIVYREQKLFAEKINYYKEYLIV